MTATVEEMTPISKEPEAPKLKTKRKAAVAKTAMTS